MRLLTLIAVTVSLGVAGSRELTPITDHRSSPHTYVTSPQGGGRYYARITPSKQNDALNCRCAVYKVADNGSDQLLWQASVPYARSAFMTNGGEDVILLDTWPGGEGPSLTHACLWFVNATGVIRSYSTAELVKDASKIERTQTGYFFLADIGHFVDDDKLGYHFKMTTIDGVDHKFKPGTGDMLTNGSPR